MTAINFPLTNFLWSQVQLVDGDQADPKEEPSTGARCWTVVAAAVAVLVTPLFLLFDLIYLAARKIFCCESPQDGGGEKARVDGVQGNGGKKASCVDFYRGAKNSDGLTLDQILAWNDDQLESVHTFIQWLFPNKKPSSVNPSAPTIDASTIAAFSADAALRVKLLASFKRMLSFYGLVLNESNMTISRTANFSLRARNFLTPGNHNFLRITRIISCLSSLGLKPQAQAFLRVMEDISQQEGKGIISAENLSIWRSALH